MRGEKHGFSPDFRRILLGGFLQAFHEGGRLRRQVALLPVALRRLLLRLLLLLHLLHLRHLHRLHRHRFYFLWGLWRHHWVRNSWVVLWWLWLLTLRVVLLG